MACLVHCPTSDARYRTLLEDLARLEECSVCNGTERQTHRLSQGFELSGLENMLAACISSGKAGFTGWDTRDGKRINFITSVTTHLFT